MNRSFHRLVVFLSCFNDFVDLYRSMPRVGPTHTFRYGRPWYKHCCGENGWYSSSGCPPCNTAGTATRSESLWELRVDDKEAANVTKPSSDDGSFEVNIRADTQYFVWRQAPDELVVKRTSPHPSEWMNWKTYRRQCTWNGHLNIQLKFAGSDWALFNMSYPADDWWKWVRSH